MLCSVSCIMYTIDGQEWRKQCKENKERKKIGQPWHQILHKKKRKQFRLSGPLSAEIPDHRFGQYNSCFF